MRRLLIALSLIGVAACADKLTGPDAQAAARSHLNDVVASSVLVVVDGVIVDTAYLRQMNTGDIEEIEVIKGKAAEELYGKRAGHGAILVTTKRPK